MEVEYELGLEDALAFNGYYYANSPTVRRQLIVGRLVQPIFLVVLWLVLCLFGDLVLLVASGVVLVAVAVLLLLRYPAKYRQSVAQMVRRMYSEGVNLGLFCRHKLTITPETITDATEVTVTTRKWVVVEKIVVDRQHAYFYVQAFQALILPKAAFTTDAEFDEFVETARGYRREATA